MPVSKVVHTVEGHGIREPAGPEQKFPKMHAPDAARPSPNYACLPVRRRFLAKDPSRCSREVVICGSAGEGPGTNPGVGANAGPGEQKGKRRSPAAPRGV